MITIGVFEARTRLPDLLKRVSEQGESVTITNRGEPVADLVPSAQRATKQVQAAIQAIKAMRTGAIDGDQFTEMRKRGRR